VRPRTLVAYRSAFRVLGEGFDSEPISQITTNDLEEYLADQEWMPRTRKNYMVTLSTLFTFAQSRDYCPSNPMVKIPRPLLEDKPIGILSIKDVKSLLQTAVGHAPKMVPSIAIALFAGLRRSELCALDWSEINLTAGMIEVKGAKAKTRQRRIVHVSDGLKAWLMPVQQARGPVTHSPRDDTWGAHLHDLVVKAGIENYPHNALRHSFGSYHYELHRNEQLTSSQMGNSPAVIFRHYRHLVAPAEAKEYFVIQPPSMGCSTSAGVPARVGSAMANEANTD